MLHHPFLFKVKPTQCSRGSKKDFWRRCRGGLRKSQHTKYPPQTLISRITLFAIFLSPQFTLAVLFGLSLFRLPLFARFSLAMSEPKRVGGSLSSLDDPSIISKVINKAMEKPAGVVNESLNNFDEDDSGIFRYLLDESLKDAWDRLLRIRASYVPQYKSKYT